MRRLGSHPPLATATPPAAQVFHRSPEIYTLLQRSLVRDGFHSRMSLTGGPKRVWVRSRISHLWLWHTQHHEQVPCFGSISDRRSGSSESVTLYGTRWCRVPSIYTRMLRSTARTTPARTDDDLFADEPRSLPRRRLRTPYRAPDSFLSLSSVSRWNLERKLHSRLQRQRSDWRRVPS